MTKNKQYLMAAIIILSAFIRFYHLDKTPSGLYVDEAVQGYNAYSMLETGKDQYGKSYPVMTKLFGTYSSSLYTYLSIIPVKFSGLNILSVRFTSALSGIILVWVCCLYLGLLSGLVIAISPVFVFFSRGAFEANLALTLLLAAVLMAVNSEKQPKLLFFSFGLLALSGYAYHSGRFLSVFFCLYFAFTFWKRAVSKKSIIVLATVLMFLIQLPLLAVSFKPAVNSRVKELVIKGSIKEQVLNFSRLYTVYFSPDNLFSRPDPDLQRSFPELSVFYWWMAVPFLAGILKLFSERRSLSYKEKTLLLLLAISIIPGAITDDYFSTIRVLPAFVVFGWIIAIGLRDLVGKRPAILLFLVFISCLELYSNLILLKRERSLVWGYQYKELAEYIRGEEEKPIVIDNSRSKPIYILLAFYNLYDPLKIQSQYDENWLKNYYDHPDFNNDSVMGNVEIRPIFWKTDVCKDQILIGDPLSISDKQSEEHKLKLVKNINDINGEVSLQVFQTSPEEKCLIDI